MALHFRCLDCYATLAIAERRAGHDITCPNCRGPQVVPFRSDPTLSGDIDESDCADRPVLVASSRPLPDIAPKETSDAPRRSTVPPGLWIAGTFVVVAALAVLVVWSEHARKPRTPSSTTHVSVKPLSEPPSQASGNTPEPIAEQQVSKSPETTTRPRDTTAWKLPAIRWRKPVSVAKVPVAKFTTKRGPKRGQIVSRIKAWPRRSETARKNHTPPKSLPEKQLRQFLLKVPELAIDLSLAEQRKVATWMEGLTVDEIALHGPPLPTKQLDLLEGLPMVDLYHCKLPPKKAKVLAKSVTKLRMALAKCTVKDKTGTSINGKKLFSHHRSSHFDEATVRACAQILQPEDFFARRFMVQAFRRSKDTKATEALAKLAVTDPSPEIRGLARQALKNRSVKDYHQILVRYLNYPLASISANAAQVLVELQVKEAVPSLLEQLKEPDVTLPREVLFKDGVRHVVPRLVRLNHLKSCLVCHCPTNTTVIRNNARVAFPMGAVPTVGRRIPTSPGTAYYHGSGLLVRADVTYLWQDFSVLQPVAKPGRWPKLQRFDFVVQLQPVTDEQAQTLRQNYQKQLSPQRRALLYTLHQLTGRQLGHVYRDWQLFLTASAKREPSVRKVGDK